MSWHRADNDLLSRSTLLLLNLVPRHLAAAAVGLLSAVRSWCSSHGTTEIPGEVLLGIGDLLKLGRRQVETIGQAMVASGFAREVSAGVLELVDRSVVFAPDDAPRSTRGARQATTAGTAGTGKKARQARWLEKKASREASQGVSAPVSEASLSVSEGVSKASLGDAPPVSSETSHETGGRLSRDGGASLGDVSGDAPSPPIPPTPAQARAQAQAREKSPPSPPAGPGGDLGVSSEIQPPQAPEVSKAPEAPPGPKPARPRRDPHHDGALRVLGHWAATLYPDSKPVLDSKRLSRVKARLAEGFTPEQLCRAVDGAAADDFLMGRDPKTGGKSYRDVGTVLRDAAQVERLIALAPQPQPPPPPPPKAGWSPHPGRPLPGMSPRRGPQEPAPPRPTLTHEQREALQRDLAALDATRPPSPPALSDLADKEPAE